MSPPLCDSKDCPREEEGYVVLIEGYGPGAVLTGFDLSASLCKRCFDSLRYGFVARERA